MDSVQCNESRHKGYAESTKYTLNKITFTNIFTPIGHLK